MCRFVNFRSDTWANASVPNPNVDTTKQIHRIIAFVDNIILARISWLYIDSSSLSVSPDTSPKKWTDGSVRAETRRDETRRDETWRDETTNRPHDDQLDTRSARKCWVYQIFQNLPAVKLRVQDHTVIPSPICAGLLGMARTILEFSDGSNSRMRIPARILLQ